nr:hypothetical protein [Tanacetum cinerariifolium]
MDTKKSVLDLDAFREMLHISPRIPIQSFAELPSEEEILEFLRNSKAYKKYYAYATGEAAPKPKTSDKKKKGNSASSTTPPTSTPTTTVVSAPRLSATAKDKRRTSLSNVVPIQMKELVLDVPSDDSKEELSWNSFDDEDVDVQDKGDKNNESDDGNDDDIGETVKVGFEKMMMTMMKRKRLQRMIKRIQSLIRVVMKSEDEGNDDEDQDLRLSEEARIQEEEEADELYRDVNINQGRGLQLSQKIKDSHVTLTLFYPDGLQESSSMRSFMTSMLNPISDAGVESIFTTTSSPIVSLQTPTPIMTPSTIDTITTSSDAPIPSTKNPSTILKNLPTFNLAFRFDERLRSLETSFSEYRQTNPFVNVMYVILESTILKRRREDDDQEGPSTGLDRGSKRRREGGEHASTSTPSGTATGSAGRSTLGSQSKQLSTSESAFAKEPMQTTCQMEEPLHPVFETGADAQPIVHTSQHPEWFSQPKIPPSLDHFSNFIMNRLDVDTLTSKLLAGPTYELMRGSCNSLTELEYHLEEVYKATTDQLDWINPEGQQYPHNLLQPLPLIPKSRGRRVILFEHFINNNLEYLRGGASSRKYTTSVTKTKAADYGHIKWIEDLVPRAMWIQEPINYDRHALWGVSH